MALFLVLQSTFTFKPAAVLGFVAVVLVLLVYCIYQRFFSPLSKYPGPTWASLTSFWMVSQRFDTRFHRTLIEAHEKYGPVVRVKPNKLMIASPEAFKIIYGPGKGFVKGELYGVVKGKRPFDMAAERNENVHSQQRRPVSRAYAMDTMKSLEPYVDATIEVLLEKIEEAGSKGQVVDFSYLLQLFAFDVIGEVSFARRFGYLDALSDGGVFRTISAAMASAVWVGEVPWLYHLHERLAPLIGNRLAMTARNGSLHDFALRQIAARKERAGGADDHDGDIRSKLLAVHREKPQLSESDVGFMLTANVTAGSDTTSFTLAAVFYYLLTTPEALGRLLRELKDKVVSGEVKADGVVTEKVAESWSYLQAVLMEGMRLHPAIGALPPRVVPKGGLRFGDYFVPAGYEVGTTAWALHRNRGVFGDDAEDFRPERWLDEQRKHEMYRCFFSFGGGSRTCIGKNIAMLEMGKVLPTILLHFDLQLAPEKGSPKEVYGLFVALKPLNVIACKRSLLEEHSL